MRAENRDGVNGEASGDGRIQGAYDYCDGGAAFIIADVTTDEAWVAIERGEATSIEARR